MSALLPDKLGLCTFPTALKASDLGTLSLSHCSHGRRRHLLALKTRLGLRPALWVARSPPFMEATSQLGPGRGAVTLLEAESLISFSLTL